MDMMTTVLRSYQSEPATIFLSWDELLQKAVNGVGGTAVREGV